MELKIKVSKIGIAPGTLGWLVANASEIQIGAGKYGPRAALLGRDGKEIEVLAYTSEFGDIMQQEFKAYANQFSTSHPWTPAAQAVLANLASEAIDLLRLGEEAEAGEVIKVTLDKPALQK